MNSIPEFSNIRNRLDLALTSAKNRVYNRISTANEIRAKERETTYGPIIERPRIPYVGSEFEATSITPTGIPLAPKNVALTVGEEIPEDKSAISKFLSGTLPQKVLPTNAEKALSQALRGANVSEFEFRDYMQNRRLLNAKKPPEYKPMGGELTLYNKNTNQEIRAQRYLVVNSDGTTSNVLMNIQTGELEQDPNQFTFEKPEEGSFIYSKSLTPLTIVTDGGRIFRI